MKKIIQSILPTFFINILVDITYKYFDGYGIKSYSQEGEDMILRRIFEKQKKGFYIDVGAHHPKRFSNTFFFYQMGWRGINIDAMPNSMIKFNKMRSKDINIEQAISLKSQTLTYYAFNEPALNGFSQKISEERDGKGEYFVEYTREIKTVTLAEVLEKYVSKNQEIDFLSIDVEGLDFEVLQSNDFTKYRPKIILIEMLDNRMEDVQADDVSAYLKQCDYLIFGKTVNTVIFMDNTFYSDRLSKK